MSIRSIVNEKPMVAGGVVVGLIVLVVLATHNFSSESGATGSAYYTTDDGATWFASDTSELAPFMHGGKQAVRAYLFASDDGKKFVGYLERYTDEAKAILAEAAASKQTGKMPNMGKVQAADMGGRLIKKPGDKDWVSGRDMGKVIKIRTVVGADGKAALPVQ